MRSLRTRLAPLAALSAAALLTGCLFQTEHRRAGVDDFPNSIYARVNGFMDEGKKADSLQPPAAADSILLSAPAPTVPVAKAKQAGQQLLAKSARLLATPGPCDGVFLIVKDTVETGFKRSRRDSLEVCVDSAFRDLIPGNEHIVRGKSITTYDTTNGFSDRVETVEVGDADGDGYINLVLGRNSKVRISLTTYEKGVTEHLLLVQGPGPDNLLDKAFEADNLNYELSWNKTRGADTLASAVYSDADSDGVAIDNGKPSLVGLDYFAVGPTQDDPNVVWSRMHLVMTVRYGVATQEMHGFKAESETKDGRLNNAVIVNRQGGERFDFKDTIEARFTVVGTTDVDTVDTMKTTVVLSAGKDFDKKDDDSIYAIHVHAKKKLGEEKTAAFDFVSDAGGVPSGKDPESGSISMHIDYTDGTLLDVQGKFTKTTMDVTVEQRDGKKLHVVWDRSGKGLLLEEIH